MSTIDQVLALLYDRGEGFMGLDELARAAGQDRAAVDDVLAQLRQRGQRLEFSPSNGVRLLRPIRLTGALIERKLPVRRVGRSVICFDEVDSTNDVALKAIRQDDADGLVVLAESQRRGRGRQGRQWVSPAGRNLLLSALLVEPAARGALRHDALTIAAGLAVAEAVEDSTRLVCDLKWPNDVLLAGAKVAGVLVETRREAAALGVVVGVGLNVNAAPPPEAVDRPATCLADHLAHPVERTEIARSLLVRLDRWVERIENGQVEKLHDGFLARCRMINERITVLCQGRHHTGRVLDVDPLAGLILARDDGGTSRLAAVSTTVVDHPLES